MAFKFTIVAVIAIIAVALIIGPNLTTRSTVVVHEKWQTRVFEWVACHEKRDSFFTVNNKNEIVPTVMWSERRQKPFCNASPEDCIDEKGQSWCIIGNTGERLVSMPTLVEQERVKKQQRIAARVQAELDQAEIDRKIVERNCGKPYRIVLEKVGKTKRTKRCTGYRRVPLRRTAGGTVILKARGMTIEWKEGVSAIDLIEDHYHFFNTSSARTALVLKDGDVSVTVTYGFAMNSR